MEIYRQVSGEADADRLPPPGLDRPFPNLASVPPRPERPTAETREAISAALREDRAQSRDPLVLRTVPGTAAPGGASGASSLPAGPPPRPALAAAPRIPWTEPGSGAAPAPPGRSGGAAPAPAAAVQPALPEMPEEAPAPPPPDLLGAPPAPPGRDLLGIPPPPGPDLLAPPRPR